MRGKIHLAGRLAGLYPKPGSRRQGFTLFEFLIVILIISILGVTALERLLFYQGMAEKVAVEQTVGTLRSALHLQLASYIVKGKQREIPGLAQDNPMNWLAEKPYNYAGEYFDPKPGDIAEGSWYFDMRNRYLVYLVQNGQQFVPAREGDPKWMRYQVRLIYNDAEKDEKAAQNPDVKIENLGGAVLAPIDPGSWKTG